MLKAGMGEHTDSSTVIAIGLRTLMGCGCQLQCFVLLERNTMIIEVRRGVRGITLVKRRYRLGWQIHTKNICIGVNRGNYHTRQRFIQCCGGYVVRCPQRIINGNNTISPVSVASTWCYYWVVFSIVDPLSWSAYLVSCFIN